MKSRPMTSARDQPKVRSATGFHSVISISSLAETKASCAVSSTARLSVVRRRSELTIDCTAL